MTTTSRHIGLKVVVPCVLLVGQLLATWGHCAKAQVITDGKSGTETPANVLSPEQWRRVDGAVNRALHWLLSRQEADGSFPTRELGQPGVTSLCILAFMAHGHGRGDG